MDTLFETARHDNEHKKMLGFKGIKAYLNSVKNIPVGEIEEMMAILIEASFSKNKDIVLSASEAFTYAVTEYLKVWKEQPETIPLLVKGLLQYTAIDIKLVQQRAFSLLLVICYFGKENASFGKAVLQATAIPAQVKLEQFLTYNTQHLERLITQHAQLRLQKENALFASGTGARPATLFGLKPVLELLLVSTKKRQSEILKDICKMLRKENVELDSSIFEALQLFFRYRDKNIIESLATAFEKVSEKLLHQQEQDGVKVDGSLLLKYFSLIQSLIESNVDICLKVAKSLHTLTDLFSVDISDCAKVVINNLLQCLFSLSKFFKETPQDNKQAPSKGLTIPPPQISSTLLSPRNQVGDKPPSVGGRSHRALPAVTQGTQEEQSSVLEFARQGSTIKEVGLAGEEVRELLSKIQIYESEGAVFKIHNTLVRIFINLMIKESGSLLITYEEGIEFTKSLIVKSTQEFPEYMQDQIRRLVNARIKSFRFQEIFLDAGFYKYVKQLFNVKNQELLRALIKIYQILITLNFEANQELVNSILAELSEILAFSSRHEIISQIIAIFISSSPQSLSFITLEQLGSLYAQMARTSNLDLLLEITKLIIIFFRDVPELSVAQPVHRTLVSQIVTSLVAKLKENQPKQLPSSASSRGLSDRHHMHERPSFLLDQVTFAAQLAQNAANSSSSNQVQALAMQKAIEKHNQHRKLIQVLLSYAKEIASIGEKNELPQSLLCDTDALRVLGEAVVRQARNEEFLMQLLRVCVAGCGSLSMKVSEEQSKVQAYISRLLFQLCEDIINVIQKSSENYYCKVLANDLFNLTMLMNLPTTDLTLLYFRKLTRLFKHPLDEIAVNSISFFGSYFVIHCDTHGIVPMYQQLEIVAQLAERVIESPPLKSVLGQNHKTQPLLIELFCSLHKLFKQELLLTPFSKKEQLIGKMLQILGSSKHVPLLLNIANTLRVMLPDPQCDAIFFERPDSLLTLNSLLLSYIDDPIKYARLTETLLESLDLASRNANNHAFFLHAQVPLQLHYLISKPSSLPSLELELNIATILHNMCNFSSPETILSCLDQKCVQTLELLLLSQNIDYQKGVIVLQTMFAMLDSQHQSVAPLLSSLTGELINLSKSGKFFKHRKIAEAIMTELGIDVTPFSPNQEQDMLTIFKQFNIGS